MSDDDRVDVTQWVKTMSSALPVGSMVKKIDLKDAMNSIEVAEPRMDTGATSSTRKQQGLFDPQMPLSPEELCWIMDEMLSMEVAWWQGVNLAQSVFTCLYYLHPDRLDGPDVSPLISIVFKAFLLAYCKSIDLAYKEFNKGHVQDMEDVWLDHYGIAVHLEDKAEDIATLVDHARVWLEEYYHPNRQELSRRLQLRLALLLALHAAPTHPLGSFTPLKRPSAPTHPLATPVFADVTPYLRQTIPPSFVTIPSHDEAWTVTNEALVMIFELRDIGCDSLTWQIITRARAWQRHDLTLVRSLQKSYFDAGIPAMTRYYIPSISHLHNNFMEDLYSRAAPSDRQQFAIWRDIIGGLTITTLSTPTLNRPRQRRSYQSLAFSWRERAAYAQRLGFNEAADACLAIRLDCLLEGALAAIDCDLISAYEQQQMWWWIAVIARDRVDTHLRRAWQMVWAEMWMHIAEAMFLLLAAYPLPGPDTRERFNLRHKWDLKLPTMPDGNKVDIGLGPQYDHWLTAKAETQANPSRLRERATMAFTQALRVMQALLHSTDLGADPRLFITTLTELRQDIAHNMQATTGRWGKRRRWLALLQSD